MLWFGTADAFCYDMRTLIMEHVERPKPRLRTRDEAARVLEELRELYQALSRDEQDLVRGRLSSLSKVQRSVESEKF